MKFFHEDDPWDWTDWVSAAITSSVIFASLLVILIILGILK